MADNDNLEANLENIRISELPETNTVDKNTDFLPVVKESTLYTSGYQTFKVTPAKLLAEAAEYTAGDHIAISANNEISATYKAGTNITIDNDGTISAAGGGSNVEVTQVQSTGTKIATITVDSVGTDLYAPNGGGGASALDDLSDVSINTSTLASGQVIKYDGTSWVNGTESGGGSTVSVTQIQSAGTKIATITVDSVDTDLYAPNGGGSGGHTILDDSGTALTQRTKLQFKGAYSEDNSGNDTTEVNVVRSMTKAEFDLLSEDEKNGLINITDDISGGLKYVKETLWENIDESDMTILSDGSTITLTDNILDYDEIYFEGCFYETNNATGKKITHLTVTKVMKDTIAFAKSKYGTGQDEGMFDVVHNFIISGGQTYCFMYCLKVPTDSSLYVAFKYVQGWNASLCTLTRIIGIKYLSENEHAYSTDEQIVGKWIDGSTLYEKTLQLTNVSMNTGWAVIGNIPNIAKLISCNQQELVPSEHTYGYTGLPAVYYYNSGNIALYNFLGGHMGSISGYVTVRYTKVSV